jgi:hypothetical protein
MLELVHRIVYSYDTHSIAEEKFYINDEECTMCQFYNVLNKHNNLVYHSRMNKTNNSTEYAELYRSNSNE